MRYSCEVLQIVKENMCYSIWHINGEGKNQKKFLCLVESEKNESCKKQNKQRWNGDRIHESYNEAGQTLCLQAVT